jgi:hypothetical protein
MECKIKAHLNESEMLLLEVFGTHYIDNTIIKLGVCICQTKKLSSRYRRA